MKIWVKTAEFSEGKFLVVRRDGTTPDWPHFVMGARDPCVPAALQEYAVEAERRGLDKAYCDSVSELGDDFEAYLKGAGAGDPDAPPHRTDAPLVLAMMRHEISMQDVIAALSRIAEITTDQHVKAIALITLDGKIPNSIKGRP